MKQRYRCWYQVKCLRKAPHEYLVGDELKTTWKYEYYKVYGISESNDLNKLVKKYRGIMKIKSHKGECSINKIMRVGA